MRLRFNLHCLLKQINSRVYICVQKPQGVLSSHLRMPRIPHKWVVFVAAVLVAFFDYGIAVSFGGVYIALLDTFNAGRGNTGLVHSLFITFCWGFSVISGVLISRFGIKIVTYGAAVFAGIGFVLSYFATSIYQLYGFISLMIGCGSATMYVAAVMCVGMSFSGRQRSIAISVQSVGTAVSGFVWPRLLSVCLDKYSLRGTFLILGGLFLNNIVFAIVFAETEVKKTTDTAEEQSNKAPSECITEMTKLVSEITNQSDCPVDDCEVADDESNQKVNQPNELRKSTNDVYSNQKEANANRIENNKFQSGGSGNEAELEGTHQSDVTKDTHVGVVKVESKPDDVSPYERNVYSNKRLPAAEDMAELRKTSTCLDPLVVLYSIYTLACILHMATLAGYLTVYQDINIYHGLSVVQSDIAFMGWSFVNVLSRFLPMIPARIRGINSFTIPILSSLCGAIGQIILLSTTPSMKTTMVALAILGIADGGCVASIQAIMFEILPAERQAVGFGFVLTAMGLASTATGPLFGLMRDSFTSYQLVLTITTVTFGVSVVLECVCLVLHVSIQRRNKA